MAHQVFTPCVIHSSFTTIGWFTSKDVNLIHLPHVRKSQIKTSGSHVKKMAYGRCAHICGRIGAGIGNGGYGLERHMTGSPAQDRHDCETQ